MDEQKHTYPARTARVIVEKAIQYGMPVPKVVNMYETAKTGAKESNSTKMQGSDGKSWRAAYFTVLRNMFESGLKKYSAKMPAFCRDEVKGILTRNKEKLIEELTRDENSKTIIPGPENDGPAEYPLLK